MTGAVRILRHHLLIRAPVVALLMIAWFIITNHCALGLMQRTTAARNEHAHCHGGKTKQDGAPGETRECCKTMRVVPLTTNAEVKFDASKFEVQIFALVQVFAAPQKEPLRTMFVFDHGPPRCISFAESVLQRSLLSHAPPFAV
jgi:hypothetical protein